MFQSITRIYKLNIPNIFYWSPKITAPRILSCHFRWLAIMVPVKPLKNGLFQIAFFFEKICYRNVKARLKKDFAAEFSAISNNYQKREVKNQTVWYSWWQGIDAAPELVKVCIQQMQQQFPTGTTFINIDHLNFTDYVDLSPRILELFESGKMTQAHFSDQLRINLLAKYGGIWVDATLLIIQKQDETIFDLPFFSYRSKKSLPIASDHGMRQGNWQMYVWGGTDIYLYEALKIVNDAYWNRYSKVIHYLQLDKMIDLTFEVLPELSAEMKKLPLHDHDPGDLLAGGYQYNLSQAVTDRGLADISKDFEFIKLSWKIKMPKIRDGQLTIYGALMK